MLSIIAFLPWFFWSHNISPNIGVRFGIPLVASIVKVISVLSPAFVFMIFSPFGIFSKRESWLLLLLLLIPFIGVYIADNSASYFFNARQLIFSIPLFIILASASVVEFYYAFSRAIEHENKPRMKWMQNVLGGILLLVFVYANGIQIWTYLR
jgi:hypothetical protein